MIYESGGKLGDGTVVSFRADESTHAITVVDTAHHELHEGNHFVYRDNITLANNASGVYLITTPDTTLWAHMVIELDASLLITMDVYEGTNRNGTTPQTELNRNRNSANTSTTVVHKGVSGGSSDGTLLYTFKAGTATGPSRFGGSDRGNTELVLRQNTKYLVKLTSGTNDNIINLKLDWYEHTNGD